MKSFKNFLSGILLLLLLWPASFALAKDKTIPNISQIIVNPALSNGEKDINIKFRLSEKSKVYLKVYKNNKLVKTGLNGSIKKAGIVSWTWPGKKSEGTYFVFINAIDMAKNKSKQHNAIIDIDRTNPVITGQKANLQAFNPITTGNFNMSFNLSEKAKVGVKLFGGKYLKGYQLKTISGVKGLNSLVWDGKFGTLAGPDGKYTLEITAIDGAGNISKKVYVQTVKDTMAPLTSKAIFDKPKFNPTTETNRFSYLINEDVKFKLNVFDSENELVFTNENIFTTANYASVGNIVWNGKNRNGEALKEGSYSFRAEFIDRAGNKTSSIGTVLVSDGGPIITTSPFGTSFNATGTNSVALNYELSEASTISIKVLKGTTVVKTIFSGSGVKGANNATWDGKNNNGELVASGIYTFVINAVDSIGNVSAEVKADINVVNSVNDDNSGGNNGGGNNGGGQTSIAVSSINVSGANNSTAISSDDGTLQMAATVLPLNATNPSVTWSVINGTGKASISAGGLVTAQENGTVTVKATANDGSNISGTLVVSISGQILNGNATINQSTDYRGMIINGNITVNSTGITLENATINGNVTVNKPSVSLKNLTINGNLTIGAGVADGEVILVKVDVSGTTNVLGGGPNSIKVYNSKLVTVIINKEEGSVRILAAGSTQIQETQLQSAAILEEENLNAGFEGVTITEDVNGNSQIKLTGSFSKVENSASNVVLNANTATVNTLVLNAPTEVNINRSNELIIPENFSGGSQVTLNGSFGIIENQAPNIALEAPASNVETLILNAPASINVSRSNEVVIPESFSGNGGIQLTGNFGTVANSASNTTITVNNSAVETLTLTAPATINLANSAINFAQVLTNEAVTITGVQEMGGVPQINLISETPVSVVTTENTTLNATTLSKNTDAILTGITATPASITLQMDRFITGLSMDDIDISAKLNGDDYTNFITSTSVFDPMFNRIKFAPVTGNGNLDITVTPKQTSSKLGGTAQTVTVDLSAGFEGRITDRNGRGLSGLNVDFRSEYASNNGQVIASVTTDAYGFYKVIIPSGVFGELTGTISGQGVIPSYMYVNLPQGAYLVNQNANALKVGGINEVKIILSWNIGGMDLDSHLIGPSYLYHISPANSKYTVNNTVYADVNTSVLEVTTIRRLIDGRYRFYVHNKTGEPPLEQSQAQVKVFIGTTTTPSYTYNVPIGTSAERYWDVLNINVLNGKPTVQSVNSMAVASTDLIKALVNTNNSFVSGVLAQAQFTASGGDVNTDVYSSVTGAIASLKKAVTDGYNVDLNASTLIIQENIDKINLANDTLQNKIAALNKATQIRIDAKAALRQALLNATTGTAQLAISNYTKAGGDTNTAIYYADTVTALNNLNTAVSAGNSVTEKATLELINEATLNITNQKNNLDAKVVLLENETTAIVNAKAELLIALESVDLTDETNALADYLASGGDVNDEIYIESEKAKNSLNDKVAAGRNMVNNLSSNLLINAKNDIYNAQNNLNTRIDALKKRTEDRLNALQALFTASYDNYYLSETEWVLGGYQGVGGSTSEAVYSDVMTALDQVKTAQQAGKNLPKNATLEQMITATNNINLAQDNLDEKSTRLELAYLIVLAPMNIEHAIMNQNYYAEVFGNTTDAVYTDVTDAIIILDAAFTPGRNFTVDTPINQVEQAVDQIWTALNDMSKKSNYISFLSRLKFLQKSATMTQNDFIKFGGNSNDAVYTDVSLKLILLEANIKTWYEYGPETPWEEVKKADMAIEDSRAAAHDSLNQLRLTTDMLRDQSHARQDLEFAMNADNYLPHADSILFEYQRVGGGTNDAVYTEVMSALDQVKSAQQAGRELLDTASVEQIIAATNNINSSLDILDEKLTRLELASLILWAPQTVAYSIGNQNGYAEVVGNTNDAVYTDVTNAIIAFKAAVVVGEELAVGAPINQVEQVVEDIRFALNDMNKKSNYIGFQTSLISIRQSAVIQQNSFVEYGGSITDAVYIELDEKILLLETNIETWFDYGPEASWEQIDASFKAISDARTEAENLLNLLTVKNDILRMQSNAIKYISYATQSKNNYIELGGSTTSAVYTELTDSTILYQDKLAHGSTALAFGTRNELMTARDAIAVAEGNFFEKWTKLNDYVYVRAELSNSMTNTDILFEAKRVEEKYIVFEGDLAATVYVDVKNAVDRLNNALENGKNLDINASVAELKNATDEIYAAKESLQTKISLLSQQVDILDVAGAFNARVVEATVYPLHGKFNGRVLVTNLNEGDRIELYNSQNQLIDSKEVNYNVRYGSDSYPLNYQLPNSYAKTGTMYLLRTRAGQTSQERLDFDFNFNEVPKLTDGQGVTFNSLTSEININLAELETTLNQSQIKIYTFSSDAKFYNAYGNYEPFVKYYPSELNRSNIHANLELVTYLVFASADEKVLAIYELDLRPSNKIALQIINDKLGDLSGVELSVFIDAGVHGITQENLNVIKATLEASELYFPNVQSVQEIVDQALAIPAPAANEVIISRPADGIAEGQTKIIIAETLEYRIVSAEGIVKQYWTRGTGFEQNTSAQTGLVAGDRIQVRVANVGEIPAGGVYTYFVSESDIGVSASPRDELNNFINDAPIVVSDAISAQDGYIQAGGSTTDAVYANIEYALLAFNDFISAGQSLAVNASDAEIKAALNSIKFRLDDLNGKQELLSKRTELLYTSNGNSWNAFYATLLIEGFISKGGNTSDAVYTEVVSALSNYDAAIESGRNMSMNAGLTEIESAIQNIVSAEKILNHKVIYLNLYLNIGSAELENQKTLEELARYTNLGGSTSDAVYMEAVDALNGYNQAIFYGMSITPDSFIDDIRNSNSKILGKADYLWLKQTILSATSTKLDATNAMTDYLASGGAADDLIYSEVTSALYDLEDKISFGQSITPEALDYELLEDTIDDINTAKAILYEKYNALIEATNGTISPQDQLITAITDAQGSMTKASLSQLDFVGAGGDTTTSVYTDITSAAYSLEGAVALGNATLDSTDPVEITAVINDLTNARINLDNCVNVIKLATVNLIELSSAKADLAAAITDAEILEAESRQTSYVAKNVGTTADVVYTDVADAINLLQLAYDGGEAKLTSNNLIEVQQALSEINSAKNILNAKVEILNAWLISHGIIEGAEWHNWRVPLLQNAYISLGGSNTDLVYTQVTDGLVQLNQVITAGKNLSMNATKDEIWTSIDTIINQVSIQQHLNNLLEIENLNLEAPEVIELGLDAQSRYIQVGGSTVDAVYMDVSEAVIQYNETLFATKTLPSDATNVMQENKIIAVKEAKNALQTAITSLEEAIALLQQNDIAIKQLQSELILAPSYLEIGVLYLNNYKNYGLDTSAAVYTDAFSALNQYKDLVDEGTGLTLNADIQEIADLTNNIVSSKDNYLKTISGKFTLIVNLMSIVNEVPNYTNGAIEVQTRYTQLGGDVSAAVYSNVSTAIISVQEAADVVKNIDINAPLEDIQELNRLIGGSVEQLTTARGILGEIVRSMEKTTTHELISSVNRDVYGTYAYRDTYFNTYQGQMVWTDGRNGNLDIYYKNFTTGEERQITSDSSDQVQAVFAGANKIVWKDWRSGHPQLYMFDLSTNEEVYLTDIVLPISSSTTTFWGPKATTNLIVWPDYRNGNFDIYSYDLNTQEIRQISSDPTNETTPDISGERIVYQKSSGGENYDIYLYDYLTDETRALTENPYSQVAPKIFGNHVFWRDDRFEPGGDPDLWHYDISSNVGEEPLIAGPGKESQPFLVGNRLVYQDDKSGNNEIYLFDMTTRIYELLISSPVEDAYPRLSSDGTKINWVRQNGTSYDLYRATITK